MSKSQKNPFGMRLLWMETLLFACTGWGRAYTVVDDWARYNKLVNYLPASLYITVSIAWGTIFAVLTAGIWQRKKWAIRWLWPILAGHVGFNVVWQQLFARAPGERERLPFIIGVTLTFLTVNWIIVCRRQMRLAFQ